MTTKWTLALETSVSHATLALAEDKRVVSRRTFTSERSQECDLFAPLRDLLGDLPEHVKLSAIVVGTGPGSYNGARVGIATAQAIAQVHGCQVAGLCSFEGVAEAADHEVILAVGDARRGSYFLMPILNGRAQTPPQLLEETGFLTELSAREVPKITFESPDRLPDGISSLVESHSTAEGLLRAWFERSPQEQELLLKTPVEAFYLRPPHITKSRKKDLMQKTDSRES